MKLDVITPHIVRIAYHQQKGDPHYGSCLWAYYDFDLDRYMLNIQSDCGNAAYRWAETPGSESFLHLMARCGDGYMMKKLFGPPELVDTDATVDEVRERLGIGENEDYMLDLDEDERQEREDAIQELSDRMDEYGGISQAAADAILTEWANDNNIEIDCIWECVVTKYAALQERIVQIFKDAGNNLISAMRPSEKHADGGPNAGRNRPAFAMPLGRRLLLDASRPASPERLLLNNF